MFFKILSYVKTVCNVSFFTYLPQQLFKSARKAHFMSSSFYLVSREKTDTLQSIVDITILIVDITI